MEYSGARTMEMMEKMKKYSITDKLLRKRTVPLLKLRENLPEVKNAAISSMNTCRYSEKEKWIVLKDLVGAAKV